MGLFLDFRTVFNGIMHAFVHCPAFFLGHGSCCQAKRKDRCNYYLFHFCVIFCQQKGKERAKPDKTLFINKL